jgi:hypothetical protein
LPSAIIAANRSKMPRYVRSSSPGWRPVRVAQHGDHTAAATHGDRQHARRLRRALDLDLALDDLAALVGAGQHGALAVVGDLADPVAVVQRLARRRAHLADDQPLVVAGADVQEEIGEAEVGEHAPLPDQLLQMRAVVAVEVGVGLDQFPKRVRHS